MANEITHETFADRVNETFRVHAQGEPLDLELTEVEMHDSGYQPEDMRQPFTLIFQGPRERMLPEGLYKVENDATGSLDLYLIPIISMGQRQSYQVVFN